MGNDLSNVVNGQYTSLFDCSVLDVVCASVYTALTSNILYDIRVTVNYTLIPRPFDGKTYYMIRQFPITHVISTNYPDCYTSVTGQLSNSKFILLLTPNPAYINQCIKDPRTKTVIMQLGM